MYTVLASSYVLLVIALIVLDNFHYLSYLHYSFIFLIYMSLLFTFRSVIEEAYNYVAEIYHPEHSLVLKAGKLLTNIINVKGDYYDAEPRVRLRVGIRIWIRVRAKY
jgi:hypothetical protein